MENLYEVNGLAFWTEEDIKLRRMFEEFFLMRLKSNLKSQNRAFDFYQVEAPILTPANLINPNYTNQDVWMQENIVDANTVPEFVSPGIAKVNPPLVLRPETTMGSYAYAQHILNPHRVPKAYPPIVIWQHGKSFRREQDQPTKFMRLKEFYQLEFQIIYSVKTANDYSVSLIPAIQEMMTAMLGTCHLENSDRIPSYAEWTKDVICDRTKMEVCSISKRTDFAEMNVLEIAIGTDRCIHSFIEEEKNKL